MNCKRLSLNLLHYYQDYRQLTRICIKDNIETIGDLENHIAVLFDIGGTFYLVCNNYYLPSSESIQLLDDNDLVGVIPNCDNEEVKEPKENKIISKKKTKKLISKDLIETIEVAESSREKKKKTRENNNLETNDEEKIKSGTEEKVPRAKKKKFKINNIVFIEAPVHRNEEVIDNTKQCQKNEEIIEEKKDKAKKSKKKDILNIQTEAEVFSTSAENEQGKEEIIKENFEQEEKFRKRRRCITPKKPYSRLTSEISAEENIFENSELLNANGNDETKTEAENNETKTEAENNEIKTKAENDNEKMEISCSPTLVKLIDNKEKQNETVDTSYEVTDFESSNKSTYSDRKSVFKELKESSGIGNVLKFLSAENSVTESDNDSCTQSENNFVTKRRRCRVRHRKKKDNLLEEEIVIPETPIFKPPKTKAAPKSHIKFSSDDKIEDFNESKNILFQSTPKDDKVKNTVFDKTSFLNKAKIAFRNLDVSKCADLPGIPSVNNLIIFKRLKLSETYEPTMSNYILAEVNDVIENGKQLKITIIDGLTEFKEPNGRFSCILDEDGCVIDETIVIERIELIEPKLFLV